MSFSTSCDEGRYKEQPKFANTNTNSWCIQHSMKVLKFPTCIWQWHWEQRNSFVFYIWYWDHRAGLMRSIYGQKLLTCIFEPVMAYLGTTSFLLIVLTRGLQRIRGHIFVAYVPNFWFIQCRKKGNIANMSKIFVQQINLYNHVYSSCAFDEKYVLFKRQIK